MRPTRGLPPAARLWQACRMSNRLALMLFSLIAGLLALDWFHNDAQALIALGQRLLDLINRLAVWR